jgi:D-methionine transport system permease protein
VMNTVLILLVLIVFLIQFSGDRLSKHFDHRK